MPVILPPDAWAKWLGDEPAEHDELLAQLKPYPADRMHAYAIGPRVGNVRNDDPSLLEAVASS
jgi:putative SOS response-associated peptidase YedK